MATQVRDEPAARRYEVRLDGRLGGFAAYRRRPSVIAFVHTEIDERFAGRGLGSTLIRGALDDARAQRLEVLPFCPFVDAYLKRHPEYVDLVPEAQRERFGLAAPAA